MSKGTGSWDPISFVAVQRRSRVASIRYGWQGNRLEGGFKRVEQRKAAFLVILVEVCAETTLELVFCLTFALKLLKSEFHLKSTGEYCTPQDLGSNFAACNTPSCPPEDSAKTHSAHALGGPSQES